MKFLALQAKERHKSCSSFWQKENGSKAKRNLPILNFRFLSASWNPEQERKEIKLYSSLGRRRKTAAVQGKQSFPDTSESSLPPGARSGRSLKRRPWVPVSPQLPPSEWEVELNRLCSHYYLEPHWMLREQAPESSESSSPVLVRYCLHLFLLDFWVRPQMPRPKRKSSDLPLLAMSGPLSLQRVLWGPGVLRQSLRPHHHEEREAPEEHQAHLPYRHHHRRPCHPKGVRPSAAPPPVRDATSFSSQGPKGTEDPGLCLGRLWIGLRNGA